MIGVHGNDVIPGRSGHLEDIFHSIERAGDFLAETAISGILIRIRPASLTGRFDPVADLHRLCVVVEITLMFALSRQNDECRTFHDRSPLSFGFPCRERVRLLAMAATGAAWSLLSNSNKQRSIPPNRPSSMLWPKQSRIAARDLMDLTPGERCCFPSYLYADRTAKYPASSGSPSSASRLAKSSGCRLNTTAPSLRGHWLGCRSQANSIPLKSGSCR